jgi:hypothetical protein
MSFPESAEAGRWFLAHGAEFLTGRKEKRGSDPFLRPPRGNTTATASSLWTRCSEYGNHPAVHTNAAALLARCLQRKAAWSDQLVETKVGKKGQPMKFVKVLAAVAFALALTASLAVAADKKDEKAKTPPGKLGKCCAAAKEKGEACKHACCVEAAKNGKNCEKCGGTNEEKKK